MFGSSVPGAHVLLPWGQGERTLDEAVPLLIEHHILRYCGPEIAHNRNDFRYDRLYRKPVSEVLRVNAPFVDALYEMLTKRFAQSSTVAGSKDFSETNVSASGKAVSKRLPMRAWVDMINEAKLLDNVRKAWWSAYMHDCSF